MLTAIVFLPLLGAVVIALLPTTQTGLFRWVAAVFSGAALALSLVAYAAYDPRVGGLQLVERVDWVALPSVGVSYFLGADGLNLPMILLTSLLTLMAVLASWRIELRPREYFLL